MQAAGRGEARRAAITVVGTLLPGTVGLEELQNRSGVNLRMRLMTVLVRTVDNRSVVGLQKVEGLQGTLLKVDDLPIGGMS